MTTSRNDRRAFTLFELLMVIVLLAIALGVVTPLFFNSLRGQRLNMAARATVSAARYARSMAVLKQRDMTMRFDVEGGRIEVLASGGEIPPFQRTIERVRISSVEVDGEPCSTGACEVVFRRNGTCLPFSLKISDPNANYVLLKVDALSTVRAMEFGAEGR